MASSRFTHVKAWRKAFVHADRWSWNVKGAHCVMEQCSSGRCTCKYTCVSTFRFRFTRTHTHTHIGKHLPSSLLPTNTNTLLYPYIHSHVWSTPQRPAVIPWIIFTPTCWSSVAFSGRLRWEGFTSIYSKLCSLSLHINSHDCSENFQLG